jgi:hypothetical protein
MESQVSPGFEEIHEEQGVPGGGIHTGVEDQIESQVRNVLAFLIA